MRFNPHTNTKQLNFSKCTAHNQICQQLTSNQSTTENIIRANGYTRRAIKSNLHTNTLSINGLRPNVKMLSSKLMSAWGHFPQRERPHLNVN